MKLLKKIFIVIFILLFFCFAASVIVTRFYGKEVARFVIEEITSGINTEIKISEVGNLSVFQKFPFASLALYDVIVKEVAEKKMEKDTLIFLKKVFLQFNIIDIFQRNYKIKRIAVSGGFARLKIDKNGKENYLISTLSEDNEESFFLKLSRMNVSGVDISHTNFLKEEELNFRCNDAVVKGNFSSDNYRMIIAGDFFVNRYVSEDAEYFSNRNLFADAEIDVQKNIYAIKKGIFSVDKKLNFEITGSSTDKTVNLKITGKELDFVPALELFRQKEKFSNYESKGILNFVCTVKGEISKTETPSLNADFSLKNGTIKQKNTPYSLQNLQLTGKFSNGKKRTPENSFIEISEFSSTLGNGNISAKFKVKNLNNPTIIISAKANIDLTDLRKFLSIDTLENISGTAEIDATYEGILKSKNEYSAQDFRNAKSEGKISFQNVNFSLKQSQHSFQNFSGNLFMRNNDILIEQLKGNVSSTDFELNGLFRNAIAYFFLPEEKLTVEAEFSSTNLNLNELLSEEENSSDTAYILAFPKNVNFNLNADIAQLSFRKFETENIRGIVKIANNILRSENISFNAMSGNVMGNFEINASSGKELIISSDANFSNIDINKLFYSFENFGQTVIVDKHLKGAANADVRFAMSVDSALNVNENRIHVLADLTIENGELINFEPMNDVSGYIKNHKLLKRLIKVDEFEKKLQHIKFSKLKNQIRISERKIIIPTMTINSSAMQIEAEGTHTFDNAIDYQVNFFLSELLTKKEDLSEFGEIEDDGTGKKKVFLTIKGTLDNPEIDYDTKRVKKNMKDDVQKEKKIVKGILKNEFGWFKNDSTAVVPKKDGKEDFVIEWEENKAAVDTSQPVKTKNKKIKTIFDKLNSEENKKQEENFELEKGEDF